MHVRLTDRFVKSAVPKGRKSPIFMDDEVIGFACSSFAALMSPEVAHCDLAPCYKAQSGRRITHAAKRSRSRARWLSVESSSRLDLWWSMIFSETRYPLLRIML